jgi:hypothetical protein
VHQRRRDGQPRELGQVVFDRVGRMAIGFDRIVALVPGMLGMLVVPMTVLVGHAPHVVRAGHSPERVPVKREVQRDQDLLE